MKKVVVMFAVLISLMSVASSKAFATVDIFSMWMTENDSTTAVKSGDYSYTTIPTLYVHIPNTLALTRETTLWYTDTFASWTDLFTESKHIMGDTYQDIWLTPDATEWFTNGVRQAGPWTVDASFRNASGKDGAGSLGFSVAAAPEPISSALFLLGSGALALRTYRKKVSKKA